MKISQVMSTCPVTVHPGTTVRTARRMLAARGITTLPVVDARGRIVGVVGEFDLLDVARPEEPVEQVMQRTTTLVSPETGVDEAVRTLRATHFKSLPVVDAADQVVGMVSRSDIVRRLARDDGLLSQDVGDALAAAGLRGWRVEVHNGVVDLVAPDHGAHEGGRARRVAEETVGVAAVQVR